MAIQRTNVFDSTVEGEKQVCTKCKRERKIIGIKLTQKKGKKYAIVLKQRCSYDCAGSQDKEYALKAKAKEVEELTVKEEKEKSLAEKIDQALEESKEDKALVVDTSEKTEEEQKEFEEMVTDITGIEANTAEVKETIIEIPLIPDVSIKEEFEEKAKKVKVTAETEYIEEEKE